MRFLALLALALPLLAAPDPILIDINPTAGSHSSPTAAVGLNGAYYFTAFEPTTGKRHLRGAYMEREEVLSRIRVLRRTVG